MLPPKDVSPLPLKSAPSNDRNDAHADMNVSRRVLFGFLLAALATVLIGIAEPWSRPKAGSGGSCSRGSPVI